ncbi:hypothetical protein EVAR_26708_1 [Eumeta japonica]|uniref:Uncharacterized protein n=1 Tax=Eumeta variegata TaxID=151549 RepID=A0A4C1ZSU2_EUMVA|nr:hypothetical protein EVAR_26708_1 [Eumeta japonica]
MSVICGAVISASEHRAAGAGYKRRSAPASERLCSYERGARPLPPFRAPRLSRAAGRDAGADPRTPNATVKNISGMPDVVQLISVRLYNSFRGYLLRVIEASPTRWKCMIRLSDGANQ